MQKGSDKIFHVIDIPTIVLKSKWRINPRPSTSNSYNNKQIQFFCTSNISFWC